MVGGKLKCHVSSLFAIRFGYMKHLISMSAKELRTVQTIRDLIKKRITAPVAAEKLGMTERHIFRLKARMKKKGTKALAHQSRGKSGRHIVPKSEQNKIIKIIKADYSDFTPTLAAEKLDEDHNIKRDRKTIAKIMREAGLLALKKNRSVPVTHRAWRERKESFGMLIQFDGSYEAWLEDRFTNPDGGHELCLLAAIDDATGRLTRAEFAASEGVLPVMGFWHSYIEEYGLPEGIYLDKFSTYKMHMVLAAENGDTKPQFARAMGQLGTTLHFANSPQAKGRVERLFLTLQDRLIKELRLAGINTPEDANVFIIKKFIPAFDRRFARSAKKSGDRHRSLLAHEKKNLHDILSRCDLRVLRNDFTVSHRTIFYQIKETLGLALRPKEIIEVLTDPKGIIKLKARGKDVVFTHLPGHPLEEPIFAIKNGVTRIPTLAPAFT